MIKLSILGSTGSVGTQALDVVRVYRQDIELVGLVARRASDKLLNQAREFKPKYVVSYQEPEKNWLESLPKECVYLKGEEGLLAVVEESERVLNAISGIDGLCLLLCSQRTRYYLPATRNLWYVWKSLSEKSQKMWCPWIANTTPFFNCFQ